MGKAMCLLVPFIELTVSHTSVLTILAITVERSVTNTSLIFSLALPPNTDQSRRIIMRQNNVDYSFTTVDTSYIKLNPSFHSIIISI